MADDFRVNLYPAALTRIRHLERALIRALAATQRGLGATLASANGRRSFLNSMGSLAERMVSVIMSYADAAFSEGAHIAQVRLLHDLVRVGTLRVGTRFDDRQETELAPLVELPPVWEAWYTETIDEALAAYTERIRRRVGELTTQAADEGWTIPELTEKIETLVDGLTTWQAERIARTEIMRLWNMGHYAQMESSEEVIGYAYSVVMDDRTSHYCAPLHDVKVRREDLEIVPPLHPFCRSIITPLFSFDEVAESDWEPGSVARPIKGFGELPELPE